jgi:amino acid transporter
MKLKLISISFLFVASLILVPHPILADNGSGVVSPEVKANQYAQEAAFEKTSGLNFDVHIAEIIATVIKAALGLLGVIFIILLVLAGFNWMTASGNEEKIDKAKQTITRAIIGLIIIIAAYSITYFVFNALNNSIGGGTPTADHSP